MLGLRLGELIVIGFILLVVFSAARMGQLGNAVGKFVHSFRRASRGQDTIDVKPLSRVRREPDPSDADYTDSRRG